MDITQLILDDHHEQTRLFAMLDEIEPSDVKALRAIWSLLSDFLETHAKAEELHFYPALLKHGQGADDKPNAKAETLDAIKDHNEIRDAIAKVDAHEAGSPKWSEAVATARKENSDHMAEEERQGLADFRRHASLTTRHELGVLFASFEARHRMGVEAEDEDPEKYVKQNS